MGTAKRMIDESEALLGLGTDIAVQAKVLRACDRHDGYYSQTGADETAAYKLGMWMHSNGHDLVAGHSARDIQRGIKAAIENYPAESCTFCDHLEAKDRRYDPE